jgi:hypothetical protein
MRNIFAEIQGLIIRLAKEQHPVKKHFKMVTPT